VPQRVKRSTSQWSAGALENLPQPFKQIEQDLNLEKLHQAGVLDFIHPAGLGFFKDRRHVAGFEPHHFSKQPPPAYAWELQTLDLIGLAKHEEPVAYVSDNLPRMDELRHAPTRPLDAFEQAGLEALRKGEDLFVVDIAAGRRMLGSIRCVEQCARCHGAERGDLLGAFSYTLIQAPRIPSP
jgi:hypothetical protein